MGGHLRPQICESWPRDTCPHPATPAPTLVIHLVPVLFENLWPWLSAQSCHRHSSTYGLLSGLQVGTTTVWLLWSHLGPVCRAQRSPQAGAGTVDTVTTAPADGQLLLPASQPQVSVPLRRSTAALSSMSQAGPGHLWHWAVCKETTVLHTCHLPSHHQVYGCQRQELHTRAGLGDVGLVPLWPP